MSGHVILVDTSVWIDYFNGRVTDETDLLDILLRRERPLTGDLIFAEVLQGFRRDADFERARELLSTLEFSAMAGREMAIAAAQN